jgi:hypothetical protein
MRVVALSGLLVALLGAGTPAVAAPCPPDGTCCVPFVACIEATGAHFSGHAPGLDAGRIVATSSRGTSCTGRWWRTRLRFGRAEFTCDDGRSGGALYTKAQ